MRTLLTRRLALAAAALLLAALPVGAQQPKREAPPPLGTPKAFTLPPKREITLANGMKVTFVPFGTIP
jgi:zinc protease